MSVRPALVLTGPPAAGKSSTAHAVAGERPRCAVLDVDDIRQLVQSGGVAPWDGDEGIRQQQLGVRNACALASNFLSEQIEVVIADVLTVDTATLYRELLPGCVVVRLAALLSETRRRATMRPHWLTPTEFETLYKQDVTAPPAADLTIDVTNLTPQRQATAVERAWKADFI
jgi:chloramphenicol 3-O-phosphotransferase